MHCMQLYIKLYTHICTQIYKHSVELLHEAVNGNKTISADIKNFKLFTRYSKLLRQQDRYSTAEQLLRKIVARLPLQSVNHNVLIELAQVLTQLNNTDQAIKLIDTVLALDPQHIRAHVAIALVHMKQGSKGQAERGLREAIRRLGYKSPLVYQLAAVLHTSYHDNTEKLKEAENLYVYTHYMHTLTHAYPHTCTLIC